ncbi:MAG TPA: hypothetical protein VF733_06175 [Candidatus Saccharimonadales bacterium]
MSWLRRKAHRLQLFFCGTGMLLLLGIPAVSYAQGNSAIAQHFDTKDTAITPASLVSFVENDPKSVELSRITQANRLAGIVGNNPLIELSEGGGGVQVVTSGTTLALVSDVNGPVTTGDKITISPIVGVGMRATKNSIVVGTAQGSLASVASETRELTDQAGNKQKVKIGLVAVQVAVASYAPEEGTNSFIPKFFQEVANRVSGRNVSPIRVLVAALLLLLTFMSIVVLLYSSVRSSIISIGRNPLSEQAVRKSLSQVGLTILTVLMFATVVIYLILAV